MKVVKDIFNNSVHNSFKFLCDTYGYAPVYFHGSQNSLYADFIKGSVMVRIDYSFRNHFIGCTIFNHIDKVTPGMYSWKYSVTLASLIFKKNKETGSEINYTDYLPDSIGVENSCREIANLLKLSGHSIISGYEWISLADITGDTRPVPKGLP